MKLPQASLWQRIKQSNLITRLLHWEYWPIYIVNIPVVLCWVYYALQARSLFFFSAANPAIETGGVFGESKINILQRIPSDWLPVTLFASQETSIEQLFQRLQRAGLQYPLIAKPNVGERGFMVSKINSAEELEQYCNQHKLDFLLQEYVKLPEEISIMYHRFPEGGAGKVTSVCVKKKLEVWGDGKANVLELMRRQPRAKLQIARFLKQWPERLHRIPAAGERVELEPIGNHCRGTMFLNGNAHIDERLNEVIDSIGQQMQGIYYGRFDILCESLTAIKENRAFKILEFNGVASEPAHVYDPAYPLLRKYKDIFAHWQIIYQISQQQRKRGIAGMSWKEALAGLRNYRRYINMHKASKA